MKQCSKCEELKSLDEFGKAKRGKDGLRGECKLCIAEKYKAWCEANKDKLAEKRKAYNEANKDRSKAYREANKENISERMKAYNEANKEKKKAYYEANKDKLAEIMKAYYEENRSKRIEELKQIIKPNTDDEWIYVLQCGLYNKIGISKDPLRRIPEIEKETGFDVELIYLAKANHGRTTDTEAIIHHDLNHLNIPIPYKSKIVSREWFYGDLSEMVEVISRYCEIENIGGRIEKN